MSVVEDPKSGSVEPNITQLSEAVPFEAAAQLPPADDNLPPSPVTETESPDALFPIDTPNLDPVKRSRYKRIGAAVAASSVALILVGGAFVAGRSSHSDSSSQTEAAAVGFEASSTTSATSTDETKPREEATTDTAFVSPTELEGSFGNIDTITILTGEKTITAKRPQGEAFEVPAKLRSPESAVSQAVSAALMMVDCYATTGDQRCEDAFAPNTGEYDQPREMLETIREKLMMPYLETENISGYTQMVSFDDPENPAEFSSSTTIDGTVVVSLSGGSMKAMVNDSEAWQGQVAQSNGWPTYEYTALDFYFKKVDGNWTVTRFDASLHLTSRN